tara:strand:+ start:723 stop:1742 length:1020 start_codon:yes stop_codon:yes gene_type:complete
LKFNQILIIAEIGVNHNGDMILAKEMIDAAVQSGADAVKFQTFRAESLVSLGTPKVEYQKSTTSSDETHYEMIKKLELSLNDHFVLKDYCKEKEISFLSTPYDLESARFLHEEINVEMFKTASADLVDIPLHDYIASSGKPALVSVGMANLGEIENTLSIYNSKNHHNIVLLHCVSNYPCADESLNMQVLKTLRQAFQLPVGYSDHSVGNEASILAIALGAQVVEKHFTLDKKLDGPDHLASSSPEEFKSLVDAVRRAQKMLGSPIKSCQSEELQMSQVSRKSIVFAQRVEAGTILKSEHLTLKRPGTGLGSEMLEKIIGIKLAITKEKDEMLFLRDFQ